MQMSFRELPDMERTHLQGEILVSYSNPITTHSLHSCAHTHKQKHNVEIRESKTFGESEEKEI